MIYLVQEDGEETPCSVGIWAHTVVKRHPHISFDDAYWGTRRRQYRGNFYSCVFAVKTPLWKKPSDWYSKYREEVCRILSLKLDEKGYIHTPPVNYYQLVLIATLLRHPLEGATRELPDLYQIMLEHDLDPLGALCYASLPNRDAYIQNKWGEPSGPYDNANGHGVGYITTTLHRAGGALLPSYRRISAVHAMDVLKNQDATYGNLWLTEQPVSAHIELFPKRHIFGESRVWIPPTESPDNGNKK